GLMQELSLRFKEITSNFQYPKGETVVITAEQWRDWVTNYSSDAVSNLAVNRTIESLIWATQNGNQKVIAALEPVLTARHPSQLYQGLMEGLLVFGICVIIWLKPRRPGVIAGWFGFSYLVARIIGEQFRLPDAHIGFQAMGLTRGQWISIAYFGVVALIFYISKKQNLKPRGGFTKV
ncbi:MAG: prolipoprotein diacylglyceryl transferase family protein, partial [Pseudomonadota bacterium]